MTHSLVARLAKDMGFSDSRTIGRRLVAYRNKVAKAQAKRAETVSKVEVAKLFGGSK